MQKLDVKDRPIGFFDSGIGGLSVLKQAIVLLPRENFIYFGDSINAPYGTKTVTQIKELTFSAVDFLLEKGIKAVVIACNTATSAAIEDLRSKYHYMPVIGIEPALKPAVELGREGKIIIMATPVTLSESKFNNLVNEYGKEAQIQPLPCAGLAELIEKGDLYGEDIHNYLMEKLQPFLKDDIASVVLGCTHYPFVKEQISSIVGSDVPIIDGSLGTAKHLRRQLLKGNLLSERNHIGKIDIYNSLQHDFVIKLSYKLLEV